MSTWRWGDRHSEGDLWKDWTGGQSDVFFREVTAGAVWSVLPSWQIRWTPGLAMLPSPPSSLHLGPYLHYVIQSSYLLPAWPFCPRRFIDEKVKEGHGVGNRVPRATR